MLSSGSLIFGNGSSYYGFITSKGGSNRLRISSDKLILGGPLYVAPGDSLNGDVVVEDYEYKGRTATITVNGNYYDITILSFTYLIYLI